MRSIESSPKVAFKSPFRPARSFAASSSISSSLKPKREPAGVTNRAYFVGDRADAAQAARSIRALFEKYRKKGYVTCFALRRETRRSQRRGAAAAVK